MKTTRIHPPHPEPSAPPPPACGTPRRFRTALALLAWAGFLAGSAVAQTPSPPVVAGPGGQGTLVTAAQRALPSKLVDINFTIYDPDSATVNIGIAVSKDSGTTWTVPVQTFITGTGLFVPGNNIPVANSAGGATARHVVWDAGADWNGHFTRNCRVRIIASDSGSVLIPAGTFTMGNVPLAGLPNGDSDITDAPPTVATVSAFSMESNLVTGSLWQLVKDWNDNANPSHGYQLANVGSFKALDHPVQSVNWYDAVKWCNARSEMEGLTPVYYTDGLFGTVYKTGQAYPVMRRNVNGYRLPTEAEWEKAARGGATPATRFPWGDTITNGPAASGGQANYLGTAIGSIGYKSYDLGPAGFNSAFSNGAQPYTSPVGSFAANGYGLYDMAGNVWEWCWDWYDPTYAGGTDPQGPATPVFIDTLGVVRIFRGGSWSDTAAGFGVARRVHFLSPNLASNQIGFRVVRSPGQ